MGDEQHSVHRGDPVRYTFAGEIFKKPFEIERTEGVYLFTPDGRAILDAAGGALVVNIGHGRREVQRRMRAPSRRRPSWCRPSRRGAASASWSDCSIDGCPTA
jgi:adenosylmethionine-8-amino-7-oxononanoate aminotransferase